MNQLKDAFRPRKQEIRRFPLEKPLMIYKDHMDEKWIIFSNIVDLMKSSCSKDKIELRGNVSINFNIRDIPDMEIHGNLKCRSIETRNSIDVSGDINGGHISAKSICAMNIRCINIEAGEITAYGDLTSHAVSGGIVFANIISLTEEFTGNIVGAKKICAKSIDASQINATEIEVEQEISCESLDARLVKAGKISAENKNVDKEIVRKS